MSAHTPGPWTMTTVTTSCGLCHKIGPFPPKLSDPSRPRYACIYDDYPGVGNGTPELLANARLIAAAPDLLATLQELIDIEGPQPGTSAWADKARAAIAKATGESV